MLLMRQTFIQVGLSDGKVCADARPLECGPDVNPTLWILLRYLRKFFSPRFKSGQKILHHDLCCKLVFSGAVSERVFLFLK